MGSPNGISGNSTKKLYIYQRFLLVVESEKWPEFKQAAHPYDKTSHDKNVKEFHIGTNIANQLCDSADVCWTQAVCNTKVLMNRAENEITTYQTGHSLPT